MNPTEQAGSGPTTIFRNTSRAPSAAESNGVWPSTRSNHLVDYVCYMQDVPAEADVMADDRDERPQAFLAKPYPLDALQRAIRRALGTGRP